LGRNISPYRLTEFLILAFAAIGALLRIARWVHPRSLWLDEIFLAPSELTRSLHDLLFTPLQDWQAAPPGFLVLVQISVDVFGPGERSLRLVSILFGLASLPLMLAVARRILGRAGVVVAMASFSFLGPLIYYSNELKPYMCDVVISLAITLAVLIWMDDPRFRRAAVAAAIGAFGIFFSYPAVFVLAGTAVWMLIRQRRLHRPPTLSHVSTVCAIWAAAFTVDYLIFLRQFTTGEAYPHLVQYWIAQDAFMPHSPLAAFEWIFSTLVGIARSSGAMWLDYPAAALIGFLVGCAAARRRGDLLLLLAPLPIVLLASAVKKYPFGDRLSLFFVPQYLLLIAAGVESLRTNMTSKVAAVAIAGCIVLPSAQRAMGYLFHPPGREESLPAYRWVARQYRPGDVIYLSHFAEPSFHFYESQSGWPADFGATGDVYVEPDHLSPSQIVDDIKPFAGQRRVWVILIHIEGGEFDAETIARTAFDQIGRPSLTHTEPGASVFLYDCRSTDSNQTGTLTGSVGKPS
jgi:uncharacterized membrane protein